jgi:hypothetical protein
MKLKKWNSFNESNDYTEIKLFLTDEYSKDWGSFIQEFVEKNHPSVDFISLDYTGSKLEIELSGYSTDVDDCILDMDNRGMIDTTISNNINIQ